MTESATVYDFASRQRLNSRVTRPSATQEAAGIPEAGFYFRESPEVSVSYTTAYGTLNQQSVPIYSVSIFASVSLHKSPSSGNLLLDCVNKALGTDGRYEVLFRIVEDTNAGRTARFRMRCCNTPAEVWREIDDERKYVCGKGELHFDNYTGESNYLFRHLSWLAAR